MADIVTLEEYIQLDRPNIYYLIEGLIPKPGMVLLLGEPGSGKSFMALQIAMAIAQGTTFFNGRAQRGRVLYLQFDMSELIVKERLMRLKAEGVDISGSIYTLHPATAPKGINILDTQGYAILEDAIRKADPDLIIIDVLREIHNTDEDESTCMKPVGDALVRLCAGRALLLLHHPRKLMNGMDPKVVDASRGSSYLAGKVDAVWMIHDGFFYIGKSRFSAGGRYRAKRSKNGLWLFD